MRTHHFCVGLTKSKRVELDYSEYHGEFQSKSKPIYPMPQVGVLQSISLKFY